MLPYMLSVLVFLILQYMNYLPDPWATRYTIHDTKLSWKMAAKACESEGFEVATVLPSDKSKIATILDDILIWSTTYFDSKGINARLPYPFWVQTDDCNNATSTDSTSCKLCNVIQVERQGSTKKNSSRLQLVFTKKGCNQKLPFICSYKI